MHLKRSIKTKKKKVNKVKHYNDTSKTVGRKNIFMQLFMEKNILRM